MHGKDGLFFRRVGELKTKPAPGVGARYPRHLGRRTRLPRTVRTDSAATLPAMAISTQFARLRYFSRAELLRVNDHWHLSTASETPHVERPYKAFRYPVVPALYVLGATVILVVLSFTNCDDVARADDRVDRVPVYFFWKFFGKKSTVA